MEKEKFTKLMRKATRDVHAISDALVNAKLALTLSNNEVWAEGLLVFYEIFRFLEEAMCRSKKDHLGKLNIEGIQRIEAFEEDLIFYLGREWKKNYVPRDSVIKYLLHLQKIEQNNPDLLMAYVYHLYMGLMSGGQILKKKRALFRKIMPFNKQNDDGDSVVTFKGYEVSKLKRELAGTMDSIAEVLDENMKDKLLEESKMVFILNNEIIRSVKGASSVFLKRIILAIIILLLVFALYSLISS